MTPRKEWHTIVWIQDGGSIWSPLESGSRRVTSTRTVLGRVERGARRVGVWFPNSTNRLLVKLNGLRRSFLCVTSNRYTQNCAQVPYRFKGHKSAGMCVKSADFHDTAQTVYDSFTIFRMISDLHNQFDYGAQGIKTGCMWFLTSVFKLNTALNGSRHALLRWWNRRMRPHWWMLRMSPMPKVGVRKIALWPPCSPKVANHDLIHLSCFGWRHFWLSFFPCNLGNDALF